MAIVPLDTRWAAMMSLDHAARLLPLVRAADRSSAAGATTLHLASAFALPAPLKPLSPLTLRAVSAFAGEPITLTIELSAELAAELPVAARLAIENSRLHLRIAPRTDALARESVGMFIGDGLQSVHSRADAEALVKKLAALGVDAEVFGTSTPAEVPSTVVDFPLRGGFAVTRVGLIDREAVERLLTIHVLLVCTGNTCRSPMAEAIGRDLVEHSAPGSVPIQFRSAGVAAETGSPPTSDAVAAIRAMGIAPPTGRAQPLTPELARWADVIYTMTQSHERAARRIAQDQTVDTLASSDIPDPIGQGPDVYRRTAEVLKAELRTRLQQLNGDRRASSSAAPLPAKAKDHP